MSLTMRCTRGMVRPLGVALFAGVTLLMSGCFPEPTTTSPQTGKEVTIGQYMFEDAEARRKAQAEAKATQDKAQAEADEATREAKLRTAKLSANATMEQAQIQADLDSKTQHAAQLSNTALADLNARMAALDDSKTLVTQQIAKNRQAVLDSWSILKPFIGMIPVAGAQIQTAGDQAVNSWAGPAAAVSTLATIGTTAYGLVQRAGKKKADRRSKAYINHVDVLRLDPNVKAAMKNVDKVIRAKADIQLDAVPGARELLHSESVT